MRIKERSNIYVDCFHKLYKLCHVFLFKFYIFKKNAIILIFLKVQLKIIVHKFKLFIDLKDLYVKLKI